MKLGLGLGVGFGGGRKSAEEWTPAQLFAAGETGVWLDPSDLTTLFQDNSASTPVVASTDPVGAVVDKVSGSNLFTQSNVTKKPAYIESGGLSSIRFTRAQSDILVSSTVDFSSANKVTVIAGIYQTDSANFQNILQQGDGSLAGASGGAEFNLWLNNGGAGSFGSGLGRASNYDLYKDLSTVHVPRSYVVVVEFTPGASAVTTLREGGMIKNYITAGATGTVPSTFENSTLQLGGGGTTGQFAGDIYGLIIIDRALTSQEVINAETWMAAKSGVVLGETFIVDSFSDSVDTDIGAYILTSPFAQAAFQTEATAAKVVTYNNIHSTQASWAKLGLDIDGSYDSQITPSGLGSDGEVTAYVSLGSSDKLVSFVSGLQTKPSDTVLGSFVKSVTFNAPATEVTISDTNRMLVYGDSIAVGSSATNIQQSAWVLQLRRARGSSVALEGWGYRALYHDAVDSAARSAFVAKLSSYNPSILWLAIGTNDYEGGVGGYWSSSDFGSAYAALLDDLHAAMPGLTIYAQTPIVRSSEGANGFGDTLGDYRTAISTAVSTRTAYTTLVDGTTFLTTGDLVDGTHPSTTGHNLYATSVLSELGL